MRALGVLPAVLLIAGCATDAMGPAADSEARTLKITSVEQVVGSWYSCYNDHGVSLTAMTISSDGLARFTFVLNPTLTYFLEPRDGVLYLKFLGCRDRPCPNEGTPVRVVEERRRQYITVPGRNNAPWVECSRAVK